MQFYEKHVEFLRNIKTSLEVTSLENKLDNFPYNILYYQMKHLVYTTSSFSKKKHFLEGLEQKNICKKQISEVNTLQPTLVDTE